MKSEIKLSREEERAIEVGMSCSSLIHGDCLYEIANKRILEAKQDREGSFSER